MSSGFQPSELQRFGLATDEHVDSPEEDKAEAGTQRTFLRLRFNSLTLDELSEELEKRTKETQKLQEEVENETREALKKFSCIYEDKSPRESCLNHDSSEDASTFSAHQHEVTQPVVSSLDTLKQAVVQNESRYSETAHNQPQQETFTSNPQRAIMNLQTKLHELHVEMDVLSDLRLKDSRKHVDQMEKMLSMLKELQNIKTFPDQKLQESEEESLKHDTKVESLEQSVNEVYQTLRQSGNTTISNNTEISQAQVPVVHVNKDLAKNTNKLQKRSFSSKEQQGSENYNGVNQQERLEDLITSLNQEMATLTENLSSSKDKGINLCVQLELLKKLAERQNSLHHQQISELQSDVSSYKDKVCFLEQKILEGQTQLFNTQREREQSLQQVKDIQSHLCQLKQQQLELHEDAKVLTGWLEAAREQLCKAVEQKTCLQTLLEQKAQEVRKSQELLQKNEDEPHFRQQQTQQMTLENLEDAQSQCQTLQAEQETLRMKLNDREKTINALRLQIESSVQTTKQHRHTIDNLQQENSLLIKQLNQHKLEIQQLRAELVQREANLASVESERRQLRASVAEQSQRIREETLEKNQVTTQLELQRVQQTNLSKEFKELQRLHSCKNDEHEGVVLKLQSQLINACDELDKIRRTLRTLQGVDGHGLQVALDMQKEITARREQVDSLRAGIQRLEEKVEQLQQEKRSQSLETLRQLQELTFIREEKRQLANELKTLCSKDQQLRERISELEAILHKMSESFANCQDFLQVREQEYFRLKLQHALNLKELQGQNLCTVPAVSPPPLDSQSSSVQTAQTKSKKQEGSTCGLGSLRDLRGVISENHRPHTDGKVSGCSFHRRRSAPEDQHRTTPTENDERVKACSKLRRKTCSSETLLLKTPGLIGQIINSETHCMMSPVTAAKSSSFSQILSLGRKSPVHTLLTSDPDG